MSAIEHENELRMLGKIALAVVVCGWTSIIADDPMIGAVLWPILVGAILLYHRRDLRTLVRRFRLR